MSDLDKLRASGDVESVGEIMDRHGIGGNSPPVDPAETFKTELDVIYGEASNFLDGAAIKSQAEADDVTGIMAAAALKEKAIEAKRVELKKPHDDAAAGVQKIYKPLIERAAKVQTAAKTALTAWLKRVDDEQRALAAQAIKDAAEATEKAAEEHRAANASGNLEAMEAAEAAVDAAKDIADTAKVYDKAKPQAKIEGTARGIGLTTVWKAELAPNVEGETSSTTLLARWAFGRDPKRCTEMFLQMAREDVRSGARSIPGVLITSEKVAR